MEDSRRLIAICSSNLIWSLGSFVNVVFLFYIPAKFGTSELQTGIIMSCVSIAIFMGTVIYPRLINRYSPIAIYKYAVFIGALSFLLAAVFYDRFWIVLLLTWIGYIVFSLTRGLNKKIISIAISDQGRRKAYNYAFAVANLGGIFAGICSPYIFNLDVDNMRYIFMVNSISMLIAYWVLARGVEAATNTVQTKPSLSAGNKLRIDRQLLFATSAIYFGFFQISFLIPKTIEHYYSLHIYSLAIVINTLMCVVASPISIKVFIRFGINEAVTLRAGAFLMIMGFVLYNIISLPILILATICFATGELLFITNLDSYLLKIYSGHEYDQALTDVRLLGQLNRALGPIIASLCIMYLSYTAAYGFVIVYMLVGLYVFSQFNKKKYLGNSKKISA